MQIIEHETEIKSRSEHLTLVPLGDTHLGTKNCDEELFQREIDFIKRNPNTYWVFMGDACEFINISDPRWDTNVAEWIHVENLNNLVKVQADKFLEYVYPIHHKCMGVLEGNHEEKVRSRYHFSPTDYIAMELGVPNLSNVCMIRWRILRKSMGTNKQPAMRNIVIYANHGSGGGRFIGGKINKLIQTCIGFDADIYLMGHVHEKLVHEIPRLQIYGYGENMRLIHHTRYFILTGTFLKAYQQNSRSYAEPKMYNPTSLGAMHIKIKPFPNVRINGQKVDLPPEIHISQ